MPVRICTCLGILIWPSLCQVIGLGVSYFCFCFFADFLYIFLAKLHTISTCFNNSICICLSSPTNTGCRSHITLLRHTGKSFPWSMESLHEFYEHYSYLSWILQASQKNYLILDLSSTIRMLSTSWNNAQLRLLWYECICGYRAESGRPGSI